MQSLPDSFDDALAATKVDDRDRATVELARTYAALISDAAPKSTYADLLRIVAPAVASADSPAVTLAFQKIETALAAHSVASDLGPKYLAALLALGMAPAGRGVVKGGATDADQPSPLDELRERRRTRAHRAAAVDSTAP